MPKAGVGLGVVWLICSSASCVLAQDNVKHSGKPGLWEVTTTMTWQKSPDGVGRGPGAPPAGGTHVTSVCLTQEMVDAGALLPQSRGQCRIENKVVKPGSITADYVCSGKMKGKGVLSATFSDLEHETGSVHFEGTLLAGTQPKPIEWTTVSTAVLKSGQCSTGLPAPAAPKAAQ